MCRECDDELNECTVCPQNCLINYCYSLVCKTVCSGEYCWVECLK
ncbi:MAG: hypothetical protein Hyperionvirus28_29 [Hyperionvirus sp.]|uniref:Uncharacterized protein n=1 Tax=Hyperionvirus sp. TaxID=2487770 RepID=A0A3G5AE42_9VIRU|nr:MAG: hypothetical protein Hyperionvirus28_29 [Hyperionvirus sp.]